MTAAYGPRPAAERDARLGADAIGTAIADMCGRVSRAVDGRTFACARPRGHDGPHYGRDARGPVRLGYGYGPAVR